MKKRFIYFIIIFIFILLLLLIFYFLTRKTYTNEDFNIPNIKSNIDYDNDGIDDYTDIYLSALDYVKTKPKYKSKYYNGGFPNDNFGVCTDVVAFAFLNAGYNLRDLVDEDIRENMELYNIDKPDKNIDFRRVKNLKIFFDRTASTLTNNVNEYMDFQKGDIVVFDKHIAIISEKRNKKGIPYIIHNSGNLKYVEDALTKYNIVGHYRWK